MKHKQLVEAALGVRELELVIKNIKLVNVFTGEIYPAEVGIYDGYIAHIEADPDQNGNPVQLEGKEYYDGQGHYLIPGLIDTHVHIESSMMTPANFARTVIPHGTTTVVTDPHEIGNVLGKEGVKYMLEAGQETPMNQYVLVPSCVPSVPGLEEAGAEFGPEEIREMLQWEGVLGLAEVMDFPGVVNNSRRMKEILEEARQTGGFIQGHAPGLTGRQLSAYLCAGPVSDHEIRAGAEAREKLRLGMIVDARESSISHNIGEIVGELGDFDCPPNIDFCTDDREPDDLLHQGHINHVLRRAIKEGVSPVRALRYGTLQAARNLGLEELGAIAPGYRADLALVPSITDLNPIAVFYGGQLVAEDGQLSHQMAVDSHKPEHKNTVYLSLPPTEEFRIPAPIKRGTVETRVIDYVSRDSLFAKFSREQLPVREGFLDLSGDEQLNYVLVFNRHPGKESFTRGVIRNFGLKEGAVGSTISHDCHNLTVVASSPEEARIVTRALIDSGGGIACASKGRLAGHLKLPIAGLMSPLSADELSPRISSIKQQLSGMGIPGDNPLLRIATLTLAVIPEAKITDKGLVSVENQEFVSLFV